MKEWTIRLVDGKYAHVRAERFYVSVNNFLQFWSKDDVVAGYPDLQWIGFQDDTSDPALSGKK